MLEMVIWGALAFIFQYYITGYVSGNTRLFKAFNEFPDNIEAYNAIQEATKNGTSLNTPYFTKYLGYIQGNATEWRKIVKVYSLSLRNA